MIVLELFAGSGVLSQTFRERGHKAITVDWNKELPNIDYYIDVSTLTVEDVIKICGRKPDVVWASPDCTTYSIAGIHHHRRKINGKLIPISDYAKQCDDYNPKLIKLLKDLDCIYFIENPVGGFRKMDFVSDLTRYTITYCQYGHKFQKPTDIWTNHPDPKFKPMCKRGADCHESAARMSNRGTSRIKSAFVKSKLPKELCEHIVDICEEEIKE